MSKIKFTFILFFLGFLQKGLTNNPDITLMDSLKKLVFILAKEGNYEDMFRVNFYYLELAEKYKDTARICEIYNRNKHTYQQTVDFNAFNKAVDASEYFCNRCLDTFQRAVWINSKAFQYFLKNKIDSSIILYHKAADLFFKINKKIHAYEALAHLDVVYEKINKPTLATQYILDFYKQSKLENNRNFQLKALHKLASHYNLLKNGEKALHYAHEACDIAWERKDKWHISNAMENEAKAHFNLKNFNKAHQLYKEYIQYYKDSVIREERFFAIERISAQFENSKKENKIKLQEEHINNQWKLLFIAAIFSIVALFSSLAYYSLYKKLKASNTQKEFLIKEIHHRVKNNLQLLTSLLSLHSKHVKDPAALQVLKESQHRAEAMGLIHKKLYLEDDMASVEMKYYLEQLALTLLDSFGKEDRVNIMVECEPTFINADIAIPLGLITNELVTNALKHAFPNNQNGSILIKLAKNQNLKLILEVNDTGRGIDVENSRAENITFGIQLIHLLAKKLNARYETFNKNGHHAKIIFQ